MCGRYTITQDLAGLEKLVRFVPGLLCPRERGDQEGVDDVAEAGGNQKGSSAATPKNGYGKVAAWACDLKLHLAPLRLLCQN